MGDVLMVGAGGFLGAIARYGVAGLVRARVGDSSPLGTLLINVCGCFAIGLLMTALAERPEASARWRLLLGIGFLGSFTTFSAFGFETLEVYRRHGPPMAIANVAAQVVLGLLAVIAGVALARAAFGRG